MCFYLLRQKVLKVVKIIETPVANQSLKNHFFNFEGFFFYCFCDKRSDCDSKVMEEPQKQNAF